MSELFPDKNRGAIISPCGTYRYQLWRIWDETKPFMLWVMLNPSKADADRDDNTIRRCIGFARDWGYGGIYVGNLFPYRATDPKELNRQAFYKIQGADNWQHIREMVGMTDLHVLAYGSFALKFTSPLERDIYTLYLDSILSQIRNRRQWQCLGKTKDGHPLHPLYVPKCFPLVPFKP